MEQARDIPIIDVGGLSAPGDAAEAAIAAQVRATCLRCGFFYLSGHGIEADLLTAVFAANRTFHARPLAEKQEIKLNQWHRGYQVRELMGKLGLDIECVANGCEAVQAVQKHDYALVLVDVSTPTMDGLQTTREIRALDGHKAAIPIIAMTASAMDEDR
jgi:PleD family two-component response regulator